MHRKSFILKLFNGTASTAEIISIRLYRKMSVNVEYVTIWKEAVMAYPGISQERLSEFSQVLESTAECAMKCRGPPGCPSP
jgi:hypothetical protein